MKKILLITGCAAAVLCATGAEVEFGDVGVTKITSSTTNTVVAVSYGDLAGGTLMASNVVKTTNLTVGDHLYVYVNGVATGFTLAQTGENGPKYWAPETNIVRGEEGTSSSTPDPSTTAMTAAGSGFWIVRGSGYTGGSYNIYVYGKPITVEATSVTGGTAALVGNPTQSPAEPTFSVTSDGDRIMVPDNAVRGGLKTYKYTSKQEGGVWYTVAADGKRSTGLPTIPAGMGMWYIPKANSTVSW